MVWCGVMLNDFELHKRAAQCHDLLPLTECNGKAHMEGTDIIVITIHIY